MKKVTVQINGKAYSTECETMEEAIAQKAYWLTQNKKSELLDDDGYLVTTLQLQRKAAFDRSWVKDQERINNLLEA